MQVAFRRILACLIVALVPINGYAAASMAVCIGDPSHHASAASHDGSHAHEHHEEPAHHPDASAAEDHPDGHDAANECCVIASAPAPSLDFSPAPPAGRLAIPFHPASEASIFPDGLERPPRPFSL